MIAVVGQSVTVPMPFTDASGAGATGLAVTATARLAGSATTAVVTVTERGSGEYDASFVPSAIGIWSFVAATTIDGEAAGWVESVQAVTAAQFDPAAQLAAGTVTVLSPVDALTGDATVYQGDDQQAADSRSLDWSESSWPDLTGASITLTAHHERDPRLTATATGSVVTPTGEDKTVRVELTSAETDALTPGPYAFRVKATLASGNIVTLVVGTLTVVGE